MASYQRFFRNASIEDTVFFDEGPRIPENKIKPRPGVFVNTSSIDTSAIDGYRQGVELTQQKHFDKGTVKIYSGEPGHIVRKNHFGLGANDRNGPTFQELDLFNPVAFIKAQRISSSSVTFPIIIGDNDQAEHLSFDGVLEPFPIREAASLFNVDIPIPARSVKAVLMDGNTDAMMGSDQILVVSPINDSRIQGFLDLIEMFGSFSTVGFFSNSRPTVSPFVDRRLPGNFSPDVLQSTAMKSAVSQMEGDTDNYVNETQRSATAGWNYDFTAPGTDSLSFGGMTY